MKVFDKIRKNDKYIKFKEIWNNKRYGGLIKLGLWFLFFLVVAIIARIPRQSQTTTSYTTLQILEQTKSYGLEYEIKKDDEIITIEGSYNNNETIIYFDNFKYFIKDNIYLVEKDILTKIDNPFDIDFSKFNVSNIYNLIKDKKSLYENYNDNVKTTVYKVSLKEFSNLMLNQIDSQDYIEISINTVENELESIYIDLTKYMNYEVLQYKNYNITIKLNSINEIGNFIYSDYIKEGE